MIMNNKELTSLHLTDKLFPKNYESQYDLTEILQATTNTQTALFLPLRIFFSSCFIKIIPLLTVLKNISYSLHNANLLLQLRSYPF